MKAEIRSLASAGDAEPESPVSWVWEIPHKVRVSRRGLVVLWGNDEQGLVRPQGECWGLGPLTQTLTCNCIRGGLGGLGGFCVSNWRRWELWGAMNQGALKGICRG